MNLSLLAEKIIEHYLSDRATPYEIDNFPDNKHMAEIDCSVWKRVTDLPDWTGKTDYKGTMAFSAEVFSGYIIDEEGEKEYLTNIQCTDLGALVELKLNGS